MRMYVSEGLCLTFMKIRLFLIALCVLVATSLTYVMGFDQPTICEPVCYALQNINARGIEGEDKSMHC